MNRLKALAVVVVLGVGAALGQNAPPSSAEVEQRVDKILSQMTLEEKIDYIGGVDDMFIRPLPRLKLPAFKMSDGPMGVRNYGRSTAYPAGIALAATWDTALARREGESMGRDARARGVHILLGPGVNIHRAPMCGRNFEYFGEDPFLASRMAVNDIEGIQGQGVVATIKHYALNNQEWDRLGVSSDADERTMREIYLPTFEAAVKEAKVGAIMDSYNLINGVHATQNEFLNIRVAKKDWGFDGIIMSDWDSTYDGVAAANGGLDLEMPNAREMNRVKLLPAIKAGKVSEATIDDKVRRILRVMIRFGFLDREQTDASISRFSQEGSETALDVARSGMVLLKNEGGLLPFDKDKIKTIAVIGPTAYPAVTGGGGSSKVEPFFATSFLQGISDAVGGGVKVLYSPGVPSVRELFGQTVFRRDTAGLEPGLRAEFFNNPNLQGKPALTRTDEQVDFRWGEGSYTDSGPRDQFSARWTGYYFPQTDGDYHFYISGDDGYRLWVNDKLVIERWQKQGETLSTKTLQLTARQPYKIRLEYFEDNGDATIGFGIGQGDDRSLQEARQTASRADAVVLAVGFDANSEGEGGDRTFELPAGQDDLIKAVTEANPRTVVVLTSGGAVATSDWIDRVPAFLHAWYPGQEGGRALAQILFGEVSPSGKLPISFERRWEDNAVHDSYYSAPGQKKVEYKEGVFLGYRHFDRSTVKPLFPFGYGLSYTTFAYKNLELAPASLSGDQAVTVSFDVTNTGKREGAEVAEVYVGEPNARVPRPVKELKGFAKVALKAGETQRVSVTLDRRAFSYYDVAERRWTADPGDFTISVGGSSARIELTGTVHRTQ